MLRGDLVVLEPLFFSKSRGGFQGWSGSVRGDLAVLESSIFD